MASIPFTGPAVQILLDEAGLVGIWALDAPRSKVELRTRHTWGLRPLTGVFHEVSGAGTVSPGDEVSGTLKVTVASIDTRHKRRDKDLARDAFDVDRYPYITFALQRSHPPPTTSSCKALSPFATGPPPFVSDSGVVTRGGEVTIDGEAHVDRKGLRPPT